jgi:hypothetical protein
LRRDLAALPWSGPTAMRSVRVHPNR